MDIYEAMTPGAYMRYFKIRVSVEGRYNKNLTARA
jgi:hypothetical protein